MSAYDNAHTPIVLWEPSTIRSFENALRDYLSDYMTYMDENRELAGDSRSNRCETKSILPSPSASR